MARFLLICTLLLAGMTAFAQTSLSGKVTDAKTGEAQYLANVVLMKGGKVITGAETDFDGNYSMAGLDPGTYDVKCSFAGLADNLITGFTIGRDKANSLNIAMESTQLDVVVIKTHKNALINLEQNGKQLTSKEVAAMPTKNLTSIVASTAGVGQSDEGQDLTVRGSRGDGNEVIIDGVRGGTLPPAQDVEQLEITTGGLPAAMGDVSGGIISVTTKGGTAKFTGGAEVETSQGLDAFGYNLAAVNFAGPILRNKAKDPLISFRVSGQYRQRKDDNPSAIGITKVKDAVLEDLKTTPYVVTGQVQDVARNISLPIVQSRASFLTANDLENVKARVNAADSRYDINTKFDFKISKQMDVVVGGNYWNEGERVEDSDRNLINYDRNGNHTSNNFRVWGRFRHRLDAEKKDKKESSLIENVLYTIQAGYTTRNDKNSDPVHGDNLFNYGYIGKFDKRYERGFVEFSNNGVDTAFQTRFQPILYGYSTSADYNGNATLAAANQPYANLVTEGTASKLVSDDFPSQNGFIKDQFKFTYFDPTTGTGQGILGVGTDYNRFQKEQKNTTEIRIDGNFDILPTRSKTNVHSIQLGLLYEQRDERKWSINPNALWRRAQALTNTQLLGDFDLSSIKDSVHSATGFAVDIHNPLYVDSLQSTFDYNLRKSLGLSGNNTDFVNVDGLNPSQLRLDMFSADELSNGRGGSTSLSYYGYDYLGNAAPANTKFEDYFTAKDARGNYTRPVAAFSPTYTVGYIQDKFKLADIIFRVGMRVDRYDANTKVLRDPFNFVDGDTYHAKEYAEKFKFTKPANIGDDFVVYSDANTSGGEGSVTAYRKGEQWYSKTGQAVNDPAGIFQGSIQAVPAFKNAFSKGFDIQSPSFDPAKTFTDYVPQLNVSPRLSFSFPISDKAGFFAHYDVLVQRPPSNGNATALDYFYFESIVAGQGRFNNPNLKPQRTIDYEVGFQQEVSKSSAIKMQVYYKEMRDMIQERQYAKAFPKTYLSYSNIDFGTVKGFTFSYDQRRTNNLQFGLAYTLQFADGTGSSVTSSRSLPEGTINRSIFALSYDERHKIVLTADYHFPRGREYDGPTLFGYKIFEDAGINILSSFTSGRPYTQELTPDTWSGNVKVGSLSGSRYPWNNVVNLRLDKNFELSKKKDHPLTLNVYFRVQNLLDTRNILQVYSVTGSPYNDGYLTSTLGAGARDNSVNPQSYALLYNSIMLNPDYFSLPRRMFVGAQFSF
jgi:hypothetical protein